MQSLKTLAAIEILLILGLLLFRVALARSQRDVLRPGAIAVTLLTPAVGLLCGNALIFYAYLLVAVAFNARSRATLAATYLLMLPMIPALGQQTAAGDVYLLPISAIGAMNLGALIGVAVTPKQRAFVRPGYDIAVLLLIAMFVFIDARGVGAIALARFFFLSVVGFGGPYLLVSRGIASRADLDRALLSLVLAGFLAAVIAVFQTGRHWVLYQTFYQALHVAIPLQSFTSFVRGGLLRTGGPLLDFSVAGVFFAAVLMALPYLKPKFHALRFWGVVAAILGGLFVTQSRGAWVGAALGFAVMLSYRGRLWQTVALVAVAGLLRFVLFLSLSDHSRLAETFGKSGDSAFTADYRKNLLSSGLDQVRAHPLTGQPPKQLVANLPDLVQGQHIVDFVNTHLYMAMTTGVPGFLLWLAIWLMPVMHCWQRRKAAPAGANPAEVPVGIIAATMVALTATSAGDRNLSWPTIALALAGACAALAGRTDAIRPRPRRKLVASPIARSAPVPATAEV